MYKVYAKHKDNLVYHIYSTCFEEVQEDDVFIKEGDGDEFVHVGYYQVMDFNDCHNYKIVDGEMVETTEEEKLKEFEDNKIDILIQTKTIEELTKENQQLWDTVEYLLKQTEMIP